MNKQSRGFSSIVILLLIVVIAIVVICIIVLKKSGTPISNVTSSQSASSTTVTNDKVIPASPAAIGVSESTLVGIWGRDTNADCISTDPADPCVKAIAYMDFGSKEKGYGYNFSVHDSSQTNDCIWKLTKPEDLVSIDCPEENNDVSFRIISLTKDDLAITYGDVSKAVIFKKNFKE